MSCYGNSKAPAVDLSHTVCNRMIANGGWGKRKKEKKKAKQQQLNLLLLRVKDLCPKGQMNSLKSSSNACFINFVIIKNTY